MSGWVYSEGVELEGRRCRGLRQRAHRESLELTLLNGEAVVATERYRFELGDGTRERPATSLEWAGRPADVVRGQDGGKHPVARGVGRGTCLPHRQFFKSCGPQGHVGNDRQGQGVALLIFRQAHQPTRGTRDTQHRGADVVPRIRTQPGEPDVSAEHLVCRHDAEQCRRAVDVLRLRDREDSGDDVARMPAVALSVEAVVEVEHPQHHAVGECGQVRTGGRAIHENGCLSRTLHWANGFRDRTRYRCRRRVVPTECAAQCVDEHPLRGMHDVAG